MFALCRPKDPRGTPQIWAQSDPPPVDLSVGDIRSQIAAKWLQIAQRSQWRAYKKLPSLFLMVLSLTPYDLPFPQNGVPYAPKIREWPYLCNGWSDVWFYGRVFGDGGSNGSITIQDGGRRHLGKISNGHISATGRPIHFMFGYRVGFSGTADLMALFSIRTNSRWRRPPSWIISNGHISATAHGLLIAHIARSSLR